MCGQILTIYLHFVSNWYLYHSVISWVRQLPALELLNDGISKYYLLQVWLKMHEMPVDYFGIVRLETKHTLSLRMSTSPYMALNLSVCLIDKTRLKVESDYKMCGLRLLSGGCKERGSNNINCKSIFHCMLHLNLL